MVHPGFGTRSPAERFSVGRMDIARHLYAQTTAFADAVAGLDPSATVPTCPEWRVRDLVAHIGQAPRWAAEIVRTNEFNGYPDPRDADPGPQDRWRDWLVAGAREVDQAVAETDAVAWTPVGPRPAAFWLRRMLCDLTVHHADAALTAGRPYVIPSELAEETITEGLELFEAAQAPPGNGETLHLNAIEGPAPWRITRTPAGVTVARSGVEADVEVAGAVTELLLVFTRRAPVSSIKVRGNHALVDHWLANLPF